MVDVRLERRLGIGEHGEIELLPGANLRRLALADIGDEPHGRQVADGEDRVDDAGAGVADVLAGTDLALHDGAGQRRIDRRLGTDLALLLECRDLGIGLAKNGKAIARRFERGFGGAQIGPRLGKVGRRGLEVAQRARLALVQRAVLLLDDLGDRHARLRPVDRGKRGEEIVLRLHHVGGFDVEQRLPALHHVARLGHQPGHPPGIGRKDRRRLVLVDRDLAFGHVLRAERHRLDRLHAERCPLRRRRHKARDPFGLAGHFGVRRAGRPWGRARPASSAQ